MKLIQDLTLDLLPGRSLLDELRAAGVKVAIGSSSKNARTVLQRLGIADRIDAIADGYSVERPNQPRRVPARGNANKRQSNAW